MTKRRTIKNQLVEHFLYKHWASCYWNQRAVYALTDSETERCIQMRDQRNVEIAAIAEALAFVGIEVDVSLIDEHRKTGIRDAISVYGPGGLNTASAA